jgi:hypothetical protein
MFLVEIKGYLVSPNVNECTLTNTGNGIMPTGQDDGTDLSNHTLTCTIVLGKAYIILLASGRD